ncbi:hypothetical protein Egran_01115 [Elaphomyces granulatus]|uniref:ACB domain-containing protein n=1 Tax=Elaphomyces granulatus TaxID=519963 RepID=A0A232M403_9EURO|nr:hypothetical protein Egran_01115 [Elaphomyces granulatus]
MSDSIDRVFVHALNTVKKIPRTGTARPPPAERLKLYGLYKQSMEGDVEGIMDRPVGDGTDVQAERDKWDAWYSQRGLSRTEAKRRYVTTLIDTMHRYASQTPEARELVSELEFVWDQIKSNASSSSSSSPSQASHQHFSRPEHSDDGIPAELKRQLRLTHLSPISYPDHEMQKQEEEDEEEEEYQEAVDLLGDGINNNDNNLTSPAENLPRDGRIDLTRTPGDINQNRKWRRRVEQALTKMTAEIAAVREQIESRSLYNQRRSSLLAWLKWLFWAIMRQVIWNMAILGLVLVWMRLKGDRRLEKMLKAGLVDLIDRLSKLRLLRRLPLLPLLP